MAGAGQGTKLARHLGLAEYASQAGQSESFARLNERRRSRKVRCLTLPIQQEGNIDRDVLIADGAVRNWYTAVGGNLEGRFIGLSEGSSDLTVFSS